MSRPLIGITCNTLAASDWTVAAGIAAPGQEFQGLASDYPHMVEKAGGAPVVLPLTRDIDAAKDLWDSLDGLIISGGNDVSPFLYHERIAKECGALDPARDTYEITALHYALAKKMPVLGICRGIQIFNAALGGSNYQDLMTNGFEQHTLLAMPRNEPSHSVSVVPGSLLAEVLGDEKLWVNSFHHQAVRDLAAPLQAMARSEDGVIEAVYLPDQPFAMAIQWHPEMMFDSDRQLKIAQALVGAACTAGNPIRVNPERREEKSVRNGD